MCALIHYNVGKASKYHTLRSKVTKEQGISPLGPLCLLYYVSISFIPVPWASSIIIDVVKGLQDIKQSVMDDKNREREHTGNI